MAPSGARARFAANIAAVETLQTLEREGRAASADEQRILARWGGWGAQGLWQIFDEARDQYAEDRARLRDLLGDDGYAAAQRTIINAHYTNPELVREVWDGVTSLGFAGGEVLEPGCGSGTFIGMAPAGARMTGVELDPTTAAIARHLYPQATIRHESFADTRFPADRFDLTIGNVPFADTVLHDPRYNPHGHRMHNHFILKSLDMTRPGGLVAVLTSHYTMDAQNPAARRDIAARADLVGAVRLPTGAHTRTAGTDAVTDLLILRRREADREPHGFDQWELAKQATFPGPHGDEQIAVNDYFAIHHPERMLGQARIDIGMYGGPSLAVLNDTPAPLALREAIAGIEAEARTTGLGWLPREAVTIEAPSPVAAEPALSSEREGLIVARDDDTFTQVQDGVHVPFAVPATQRTELRTLLDLRDQTRELISAEARQLDDSPEMEQARQQLAASWRGYVDQYGPINRVTITQGTRTIKATAAADLDDAEVDQQSAGADGMVTVSTTTRRVPPVMHKLRQDPYANLVFALERFDEQTQHAEPAGMLTERQIVPRTTITQTDDPADALAIVMDRTGRVDLEQVAELLDTDLEQARNRLEGLIFEVPPLPNEMGEESVEPVYVTRAEYLSGHVRDKLDAAVAAAAKDPEHWQRNVTALQTVIPRDLGAGDITAKVGAVWIPASDHTAFLRDVLNDQSARVIHAGGSAWEVHNGDTWSVAARNVWGTERMPAPTIFDRMLRQEPITVFDTIDDGDKKRRVLNATDTQAAQEKAEALQNRFAEWVWEDPERTQRLLDDYNRRFNGVALRDYSAEGKNLTLPGLVHNFVPRPHQRSAVARMINEQSVALVHEVGAGKTAEMVMGCMELKRLGLVRKPAVVVPNHMLEQFSREWMQLYPQANLLAASADDLTKDKRARFVARAATNDWDAIIMTRTAFRSLGLSQANQAAYMQREVATQRAALERAKEDSDGQARRTLKGIEKALQRREESIKDKLANPNADKGLTFEETGIDYLCIDELHDFKNLATVSAIPGAGITGSQRAQDLDMKLDWLRHEHGDRVATGATATPIANSVTELYVIQRYLNPQRLTEAGITDFDSWAATFGEVVTGFETNVVGDKFQLKSRFARFQNVPELLAMFHEYADVKLAADLNLPVPAIAPREDGERAPQLVTVPQSDELAAYIADLGRRVDTIQRRGVDPSEDNMLKVSSDGRAAALDMRLVLPPEAHDLLTGPNKVEAAASEIARIWASTADNTYIDRTTGQPSPRTGGLQLVFCDLSTPNADGRWNVYDALRQELYSRGLPDGSVRFIHEAKNDAEKARLFAACRSGQVSVIIGSSSKMGVGTNIQDRVVAMVDLDAPWRPADVTQRHGRGIRQGNQNAEVALTQIITEGSFDTYMWQTLERKSRFINQIMRGSLDGAREIEDVGSDTLTFAEFKAIASGNPVLLEQAEAQDTLARFRRLQTAHERNEQSMQQTIRYCESSLADIERRRPAVAQAVERITSTAGEQFSMTFATEHHTKRADVAHAIEAWLQWQRITPYQQRDFGVIGHMAGQDITLSVGNESLTWGIAGLEEPLIREPVRDLHGPKIGLVTKLENLTQRQLPAHLHSMDASTLQLQQRLEQARASSGKPFAYAAELRAAETRYIDVERRINESQSQEQLAETPREQRVSQRLENVRNRLSSLGDAPDTPDLTSSAPSVPVPGQGCDRSGRTR